MYWPDDTACSTSPYHATQPCTVSCSSRLQQIRALDSKYFCVDDSQIPPVLTVSNNNLGAKCALAWNACCDDADCDIMQKHYDDNTYRCRDASDLSRHFHIGVRGCAAKPKKSDASTDTKLNELTALGVTLAAAKQALADAGGNVQLAANYLY